MYIQQHIYYFNLLNLTSALPLTISVHQEF